MILSIVVLSYNRPMQLERILKNFVGVHSTDICLIVKDDASPNKSDIRVVIGKYENLLDIPIFFYENERNLGYDSNLLDSFRVADSDYVFLLSDDDYVLPDNLPALVETLKIGSFDVYFTPYVVGSEERRNVVSSFDFRNIADVIYNSVLFSGLIFRRQSVLDFGLNDPFLLSCIYIQVYLAVIIILKQKSFGVAPTSILFLGGDGENFFGKNSAAKSGDILSDRKKISSNLIYQQHLLRVVDRISEDTNMSVDRLFWREYSRRLIAYGLRSRGSGIYSYKQFFYEYLRGEIKRNLVVTLFFFSFYFIPRCVAFGIYELGVKYLRKTG